MAGTRVGGVAYSGPFFAGDPAQTFRRNARTLMDSIASSGQSVARELATGAEGSAVRDRIVGRTHSLTGKRWQVTAVVSLNLAGLDRRQAARLMAITAGRQRGVTATGRRVGTTVGLEARTHAFRRATDRVSTLRADAAAVLLEGIA